MSALAMLRTLTRGERPESGVLPPARLEAGGGLIYGEEAIVAYFRAAPLTIADDAIVVEGPGHIAVFQAETALVADLFGDDVDRFWRLGSGLGIEAEPAVGVPFDPDLRQARGDAFFRADDHPALAGDAADSVLAAARGLARGWEPDAGGAPAPYRVRVFVVRAFGDRRRCAALFAVHRLGGETARSAGFSYAAGLIEGGSQRVVRDLAGEAVVARGSWRSSIK